MSIPAKEFLRCLSESRVMSAGQFRAFEESLSALDLMHDSRALAHRLVRQGKLLEYQAAVLLRGSTEGLIYGDYVVVDRLDASPTAVMVKAVNHERRETVMLKVLTSDAVQSTEARARLAREAEAASMLTHPNIMSTIELVQNDRECYLVMEYVQGMTLADIIQKQGPLPVAKAMDFLMQAAAGLEYAHHRGIIHRDIKPKSLLLNIEGVIKILDLSLVRLEGVLFSEEESPLENRLTKAEMVIGTPFYMSPEQFVDARTADERSDIYSLGCTLYFLLTGKPPYPRETPLAIVKAHQVSPIPKLGDFRDDVPGELERIYTRMLAKQPKDRYSSMTDVLQELRKQLSPAGKK